MAMDYSRIEDWILKEDCFDPEHLGKCEAVMSLWNGYLGLRSATEEQYLGETRNLLVNGTFNKFAPSAVTELPKAADMTAVEIRINKERFTLEQGTVDSYSRELNIRTARLQREIVWTSPKGDVSVDMKDTPIRRAELGNDAGIYGRVKMVQING